MLIVDSLKIFNTFNQRWMGIIKSDTEEGVRAEVGKIIFCRSLEGVDHGL